MSGPTSCPECGSFTYKPIKVLTSHAVTFFCSHCHHSQVYANGVGQPLYHPSSACYKCGSDNTDLYLKNEQGNWFRCKNCQARWLRPADTDPKFIETEPSETTEGERFMALDFNAPSEAQDTLVKNLDVLIRARYPLLAVETHEETRFIRVMNTIAALPHHRKKGLYSWSRIEGIRLIAGPGAGVQAKAVPDTEDPISCLEHIAGVEQGIFVLCDFAPYLTPHGEESPELARQLRELAWSIKSKAITVFIVGPEAPSVSGLIKELKIVDFPLPDEKEVHSILDFHVERLGQNQQVKNDVSPETADKLAQALLGLTESEIENALAKAAITYKGITPEALPLVLDEKKEAVRQTGSLTYSHPEPESNFGGYENLHKILHEASVTFTPQAQAYGVEPSKGLLLVGLPGTGKDLLKRVASSVLGRPLLDMDFGSVMGEGGGIIGQASTSIKRALSIASTVKCVLGISEFEKGVGGMESSNRTDGGETARTIAYLLNWMQEQQDVFVVATANDVRGLAPEQIRQGRFSTVVFVDLPTEADRPKIFSVHLSKRGRNPEDFDLGAATEVTKGFSGAEIEAVVKGALLDGFMDGGRAVRTDDLIARAKSIIPIGVTKKAEIEAIRSWAREHLGAIDASDATLQVGKSRAGERSLEF